MCECIQIPGVIHTHLSPLLSLTSLKATSSKIPHAMQGKKKETKKKTTLFRNRDTVAVRER